MAPLGAWSLLRVPPWMIVNSSRGPLNCNEYDSGLLAIDLNAPVAGSEVGFIHASTETTDAGEIVPLDGMPTLWFVPLKDAAVLASLARRPGLPSVTPFL